MTELVGKKVIILGGTGTLGRAMTQLILDKYADVSLLTIFSRDEVKQLEMMTLFPEEKYRMLSYMLGDVRDQERVEEIVNGHDIVVHAAAIKHVVMAERNPKECRKTNVIGTKNVVNACLKHNIERAILISTDKAVNPIGVYGKSKQDAEKIFLEQDSSTTKFRIVRLGNIIGSRGSVFEAFERQKKSGVLKVTHEDATRFCISQEEAADFVINSTSNNEGDQVISPEMKAFNILDLAKSIAPECTIEFTGLRKGDKLHEELNGVSSAECLNKHTSSLTY